MSEGTGIPQGCRPIFLRAVVDVSPMIHQIGHHLQVTLERSKHEGLRTSQEKAVDQLRVLPHQPHDLPQVTITGSSMDWCHLMKENWAAFVICQSPNSKRHHRAMMSQRVDCFPLFIWSQRGKEREERGGEKKRKDRLFVSFKRIVLSPSFILSSMWRSAIFLAEQLKDKEISWRKGKGHLSTPRSIPRL